MSKPAKTPANVLDLSAWSLALPIPSAKNPSKPQKIKQPKLATFQNEHFRVSPDGAGVIFKTYARGVTSANSRYPRSELREMAPGGKKRAAWSTRSAIPHAMTFTGAVTRTTARKPHVCCAQVHGPTEAPVMFRLERTTMYLTSYGKKIKVLDDAYVLGKKFTGRFVAGDGRIQVYYDDELVHVFDMKLDGCYFKIGLYLQSNEQHDSPTDWGEVVVYDVKLG